MAREKEKFAKDDRRTLPDPIFLLWIGERKNGWIVFNFLRNFYFGSSFIFVTTLLHGNKGFTVETIAYFSLIACQSKMQYYAQLDWMQTQDLQEILKCIKWSNKRSTSSAWGSLTPSPHAALQLGYTLLSSIVFNSVCLCWSLWSEQPSQNDSTCFSVNRR